MYDLVVMATGVNSNLLRTLAEADEGVSLPHTTRTYITEFEADEETIERLLGNAMHVFLLDIPELEFAAFIPKGRYVTLCMLGEDIDEAFVQRVLARPEVRNCFPVDLSPRVCHCSPLINMGPTGPPYRDRVVFIGDCGVTRLYKDGIGAAYRTAKAAAQTVALRGVAAADFEAHYWPICRSIDVDNRIGKVIFATTTFFKMVRLGRRAVRDMAAREQRTGSTPRMSSMLWNLFTGSAPYREIFRGTLHPGFGAGFARSLLASLRPGNGRMAQ